MREYQEFEEALATKDRLDALSELADLVYYNTCSFALDHDERDLHEVNRYVCSRVSITVEQAYTIALAKYRLRAAGPNSKDFQAEREAIEKALKINCVDCGEYFLESEINQYGYCSYCWKRK